ncbi:hypothetical protein ACGFZQ_42030 [Streptomyces sp. NPDC048254]|uniref:hypothetical protein n=1 Tax=Streptomyces sp. NPDC048254 TaxID=3365525 RepID=UPI0037108AC0
MTLLDDLGLADVAAACRATTVAPVPPQPCAAPVRQPHLLALGSRYLSCTSGRAMIDRMCRRLTRETATN